MSDTLEVLFKGHIDPIEFIVPSAANAIALIECAMEGGGSAVSLVDTHGDIILLRCAELQCCWVGETNMQDFTLQEWREVEEATQRARAAREAWAEKYSHVEAYLPKDST